MGPETHVNVVGQKSLPSEESNPKLPVVQTRRAMTMLSALFKSKIHVSVLTLISVLHKILENVNTLIVGVGTA